MRFIFIEWLGQYHISLPVFLTLSSCIYWWMENPTGLNDSLNKWKPALFNAMLLLLSKVSNPEGFKFPLFLILLRRNYTFFVKWFIIYIQVFSCVSAYWFYFSASANQKPYSRGEFICFCFSQSQAIFQGWFCQIVRLLERAKVR